VAWTLHTDTAGASDIFGPTSGTVTFLAGSTTAVVNFVKTYVVGDTSAEGNEQFYVDISLIPTKSRDFEIRRARGTGTIIDDDSSSTGIVASIGDASIQEGDSGGGHYVKFPLTLSDPQPFVPVTLTVQLSSSDAVRGGRLKGADWNGSITRTFKFLPGVVWRNVGILEYPDLKDEPDLHITATIIAVTPGTGVSIGTRNVGVATFLTDE
jgi:hypothetical protein